MRTSSIVLLNISLIYLIDNLSRVTHSIFIENHDHSRSVSRFGNDSDAWRTISAQMLAILQTTQTGTLYVYQGQEIGMKNFPRSWPVEEYKDVATINYWNL